LLKKGQALRDTVRELQTVLNFSPSLVFKTDKQCVFCEVQTAGEVEFAGVKLA